MGKRKSIWERVAARTDLYSQPLVGVPLVELSGDRRVLVECHLGVQEYSPQRIGVRVKFGSVMVWGDGLQLRHMTRQRLIIYGSIHSITLERGM